MSGGRGRRGGRGSHLQSLDVVGDAHRKTTAPADVHRGGNTLHAPHVSGVGARVIGEWWAIACVMSTSWTQGYGAMGLSSNARHVERYGALCGVRTRCVGEREGRAGAWLMVSSPSITIGGAQVPVFAPKSAPCLASVPNSSMCSYGVPDSSSMRMMALARPAESKGRRARLYS